MSCVDPLDSVDLESSLVVENDHVGSAGSIYVVAIVGEESYMLVGDVFYPGMACVIPWNPFHKDLAGYRNH